MSQLRSNTPNNKEPNIKLTQIELGILFKYQLESHPQIWGLGLFWRLAWRILQFCALK